MWLAIFYVSQVTETKKANSEMPSAKLVACKFSLVTTSKQVNHIS
jgi:hypothetical protein